MRQENSSKSDLDHKPYLEAESPSQQAGKVAEGVAQFLFDLRKRRNLADYDFVQKDMQNHQDCQFDLLQVAGVISFCENYSSEPLRAELKKGIAEYMQKVGL